MREHIRKLLDKAKPPKEPRTPRPILKSSRVNSRRVIVDGMMRCIACDEWIAITEFYVHSHKDGRKHHSSYCHDCRKKRMIIKRTGITVRRYDAMIQASKGKCAICKRDYKRPSIDHCHNSNKVRGVLCSACNAGLGLFRDSANTLRDAADYLDRY